MRGVCNCAGYIFEKIDENTTRATYIADTDLKGSVPEMIKRKVIKDQAYNVVKLSE